MLFYFDELESIRVEGKEDIILSLKGGKIFAQAKSTSADSPKNATGDLGDALKSLSRFSGDSDCIGVIYTTNREKPFGAATDTVDFISPEPIDYVFLSGTNRGIVEKYLGDIDRNKLMFHVIRFKGKNDSKCRWITEQLRYHLREINLDEAVDSKALLESWLAMIRCNLTDGPVDGEYFGCTKEHMLWVIVVQQIKWVDKYFNAHEADALVTSFGKVINTMSSRFELIARVMSDYSSQYQGIDADIYAQAVWKDYKYLWNEHKLEEYKVEKLSKALINAIIGKTNTIKKVMGELYGE